MMAINITSILSFGFIGLAFLLAYLTYKLLDRTIRSTVDINNKQIIIVSIYMILCVILGAGGVYLEITKNNLTQQALPKVLAGGISDSFFNSGLSAESLQGEWDATYYQQTGSDDIGLRIDSISKLLDKIDFKIDTSFKKLPNETITIRAEKSAFVFESKGENTLNHQVFVLWGLGRISPSKDISFTYWAARQDQFGNNVGQETFSGINYLRLEENYSLGAQRISLRGIWMGRNTYGKIVFGLTFWKKKE